LRKVLLLASLSMMLALVLSTPVMAQSTSASASAPSENAACEAVGDRLNAGDDTLTSAELLACGLSPEAISPCEGVPDPNCNNEGFPSIGGPNGVGENNECSGLPPGSPEAVACFEDLIAGLGGGSESASPTASATASPTASPTATATASATSLPETGGVSVLALGSLALLVGSGIMAFGLIRRS
jgi:hypothetical protein